MMKICFVCTGNTCRSVMAERLMKKEIKERKLKEIKVSSRGLSARGENITENSKLALKKLKASSANRKSVQLKKLDKDTLYVTMTESQKQSLNGQNVISFKSLIGREVIDPYGQDEEVYMQTASLLQEGIRVLLEKLKVWRGL